MILSVAQAVAAPGGEHFFVQLARDIAAALSVTGSLIALPDPDNGARIRTRAFILRDRPLENISYPVTGTPCEAIIDGDSRIITQGVREQYPHDPMLTEYGLDAYAGTPVRNRKGKVVGLVAVFHDGPIRHPDLLLPVLRIFAMRTAAEIEHRRSDQWLTLMTFALNQTTEALYLVDETARFINANNAACHALGYARKELIRLRVFDIDPDYPEAEWRAHWQALRTHGTLTYDTVHRHRDGHYFPVEVNASYFEHQGQTYRLALARNITERQRNEAIRATETRILGMIADGAALSSVLDALARGIETIVPDAVASILLLDPDGVHLRHGAAPSLPEDYNRAVDGIAIGPMAGSCGTAMYRREPVIVTDIDTDPLWDEYRELARAHGLRACWSTPVMDAEGACIASLALYYRAPKAPDKRYFDFVAHTADLVSIAIERYRKTEALRASEDRFRSIFASAATGIAITTTEGRFLEANPAYCRMVGYTEDELRNLNLFSLTHEDDQPGNRVLLRELLDGERDSFVIEKRYYHKNGGTVWCRISVSALRDAAGRPTGIIGGSEDITDRKAVEEQLRQSQRLEAVGQLTGGIAHDFNNLLTVIQGNAELLQEALSEDARLRPIAEMLISGARRGAELTHRLLAFARKQALEPRVVDINRLIDGMALMLRRTLGEHIEIGFTLAADAGRTLVDHTELESTLLNLAINARDAMPESGRLGIETAAVELDEDARQVDLRPGRYVRVIVSDTGSGIAPEHLRHVFEPFYTTKETGKGTGLGLSTVYGFVKQSGGHVTIHSEPGRGTTVTLYLPHAAETAPEAPVVVPPESTDTRGHETLLLVEDDPMVRRYVEGQLDSLGYRVRSATNAREALAVLRAHDDIDLLFTDIVMPGGMNGRELADAARVIRPDLRVLFTSGYIENTVLHDGRLDPDVQLLRKPYRRDELARKIRAVLCSG